MELLELKQRLRSLSVFRALLTEAPMSAALDLLAVLTEHSAEAQLLGLSQAPSVWGKLLYCLGEKGFDSLGAWLEYWLFHCDEPWPRAVAQENSTPLWDAQARRDVEMLATLAALDAGALRETLAEALPPDERSAATSLPLWDTYTLKGFEALTEWYRSHGTGAFAHSRAFLWDSGELLPVEFPDIPAQSDLLGYRLQRAQVEENTRALLAGRRVNNVLLFGDSGTGKSATVKSLLGLPDTEELRLIEIEKNSVAQLPRLIRSLAGRPQKFILFLDDLAFDEDDMTYSVLKTILEGGLEPRPDNVAIYATSNRRNLVRQTFSSRAGDEVDREETIQEKTALADRFGLRIPYLGLPKNEYLELVEHLAGKAGLDIPRESLHAQAVRWDARHPGRSPRTARQFIDSLIP